MLRNKGLGFLFACLLGTGGLVMGIAGGLEMLQIPYASQIMSWTIYGASTTPTLGFQMSSAIHVIVHALVWTLFYGGLSALILKKKDI